MKRRWLTYEERRAQREKWHEQHPHDEFGEPMYPTPPRPVRVPPRMVVPNPGYCVQPEVCNGRTFCPLDPFCTA